jgi:hypothetical protein
MAKKMAKKLRNCVYENDKDNTYQVIKSISGKAKYFGRISKDLSKAKKRAESMRDLVIGMLDKKFTYEEIKQELALIGFAEKTFKFDVKKHLKALTKEVAGGGSLVDNVVAEEDKNAPTNEPGVDDKDLPEVIETEGYKVKQIDPCATISGLNNVDLERFGQMYAHLRGTNIPKEIAEKFDPVFKEVDKINASINTLNQHINNNLPVAELLFYKHEAKTLKNKNESLETKNKTLETKLAKTKKKLQKA